MKTEEQLNKKIAKMSRKDLERFAHHVVISVYGEDGDIFLDPARDRDAYDVFADVKDDIFGCDLHPDHI